MKSIFLSYKHMPDSLPLLWTEAAICHCECFTVWYNTLCAWNSCMPKLSKERMAGYSCARDDQTSKAALIKHTKGPSSKSKYNSWSEKCWHNCSLACLNWVSVGGDIPCCLPLFINFMVMFFLPPTFFLFFCSCLLSSYLIAFWEASMGYFSMPETPFLSFPSSLF